MEWKKWSHGELGAWWPIQPFFLIIYCQYYLPFSFSSSSLAKNSIISEPWTEHVAEFKVGAFSRIYSTGKGTRNPDNLLLIFFSRCLIATSDTLYLSRNDIAIAPLWWKPNMKSTDIIPHLHYEKIESNRNKLLQFTKQRLYSSIY